MGRLVRRRVQLWQLAADAALINLAAMLALFVRFAPEAIPAGCWRVYLAGAVPLTLLRLACFWKLHLYRIAWRYVGLRDLARIAAGVALSTLLFAAAVAALGAHQVPRGVLVLEALLTGVFVGGLRLSGRGAALLRAHRRVRRRLLIVGAGDHAEALSREVRRARDHSYQLVGFLDDDPAKHGLLIRGAPVLGSIDEVHSVVRTHAVQDVIIAIPSASGEEIRRILTLCEGLPVRLRTTAGFSAFDRAAAGRREPVREVAPEDLLRRAPVDVDLESIAGYLRGETVLVTGAGGSIGSELVRQILRFGPRRVLLVGRGENSIFELEQELAAPERQRVLPLIADVRDRDRLDQIFSRHRPTVIFHAAAHKHVPLMEANAEEAVKNNILGTRHLLELASTHEVKRFVLISSDKAVNPSSIMGATKRVAEMLLQAQARLTPGTRFMAVRFGNVLGSRGSVVRTMRRQIRQRQAVTVTHPEMVRYFMTIPEAVQLVIQAGALGGRGEVFVLDMGEPVRILDLARDLIRLSGFVPGEEIPIEISGLRPGEKLYEELLTAQEGISTTRCDRILAAPSGDPDPVWLHVQVEALIQLAYAGREEALRQRLAAVVPEYQPSRPALPERRPLAIARP